jgi:SAM-dependent methyltransferase
MSGIITGDHVKPTIQQYQLTAEEVLKGYDAVSQLYQHVPSLLLWRAWEYAAYQRYTLPEPVLDIGCGDGRYFRLVWPKVRDVVGVDMDPGVAEGARRSGIYRAVHVTPAHSLSMVPDRFASAFANCALEHMDHLDEVLDSIYQRLLPDGTFLLSVVNHNILEWNTLPSLLEMIGDSVRAVALKSDYVTYHHLVNPFTPQSWIEHLDQAGFEVLEYVPIVPKITSRLFLFFDELWHVKRLDGEVGDILYPHFQGISHFSQAFRQVVAGILDMDQDWSIGSGAIFWARRRG